MVSVGLTTRISQKFRHAIPHQRQMFLWNVATVKRRFSTAVADRVALDSFAAANGISLANVPEPAGMGVFVFAGLGILNRRRR
jgi:hypothetical protein